MKMENVLRAERDGTVKKIHAKPGDSLAVDCGDHWSLLSKLVAAR